MEALMIIGAIIGLGVFVVAGIDLHKHTESIYGAGVFRLRPLSASALSVILGLISLGLTETDGSFTLNGVVVLLTAIIIVAGVAITNISKMNRMTGILSTFYQSPRVFSLSQ
jgi:ABC-type thiamin/hydroxymethylpyrimidine transport system permease subunit